MKLATLILAAVLAKGGGGGGSASADNRSNQMNPNNDAYWSSRGEDSRPSDWESRANDNADNRANQLNPQHEQYWKSRGLGKNTGGDYGDEDFHDDRNGYRRSAGHRNTGQTSPPTRSLGTVLYSSLWQWLGRLP